MKVYMQYPLGISDSQYYKSMIDNPPKDVQYINPIKGDGVINNEKQFLILNYLKKKVRTWTNRLGLVIPNAHTSPKGDYDLIQCAHCLSKNNSPYVIDVESMWQLWISGRDKERGIKKVAKYLENENCKKIIAWTEKTKQDIIKKFPKVEDKIEVVSYAMKAPQQSKKKKTKDITLFFSGRHFYSKGGLHAVEAMDRLTKMYPNIKGVINGVIPKEIEEKYSSNKKLKFYGLMPHADVLELYKAADIFVYPGYSDSFGFVFVEAMAYGLPIVTVAGCARKEIVGVSGFILDRPPKLDIKTINTLPGEFIICDIVHATSVLIDNTFIRKNMSDQGKLKVIDGKFSIQNRNDKLSKIYKDALNLNTRLDY